MVQRIKAAIIGPGNIGIDLMYKLSKSKYVELDTVIGIYPDSEGLKIAREKGYKTSHEGISTILGNDEIKIVFDSTGAKSHLKHAPLLEKDGKIAINSII
jgi:acetaldehyde dehydrogenase (acetylating)